MSKRKYTLLDYKSVSAIMRGLLAEKSLTELADKYECAIATISFIADGRSWTELHDDVPGFKAFVAARRRKKDKNHHMTKRNRRRREAKKTAKRRKPKKAVAAPKVKKVAAPKAPAAAPVAATKAAPAPAASVKPGMVFQDMDPRAKGRTLTVVGVEGDKAVVESKGRKLKISLERLTKKPSAKKGYAPVAA